MTHAHPRKRRRAIAAPVIGAALAAFTLAACERSTETAANADAPAGAPSVVLYTSADTEYANLVADAFEKQTGIGVTLVGDTEATKTTGLVQRVIAERDRPRADVWWSSEPFGTIRLDQEGLLIPFTSEPAEALFAEAAPAGWPTGLRAEDRTWYGFAQRIRVFVYNTDFVAESDVPRTLADLANPRFKGRVGIARPQFGTTRGHFAAVLAADGEERYTRWLEQLDDNDVRLFDGNASVVRAVAQGDIHVGLTDTDDVWAGLRNEWPIALAYEQAMPGAISMIDHGFGPMVIPNTVALVAKPTEQTKEARALADFLLTGPAERILAESASRNWPVSPKLAEEFAANGPPRRRAPAESAAAPTAPYPTLDATAAAITRAMQIVDEVWGAR